MESSKRSALIAAGVFGLYVLLTLVMSYPVPAQLTTHLIGDGDDMWVHYWNNWWVERVIQGKNELYHTDLLFHPQGVSLRHQNFAWLNIALWLGIKQLVGGIAAYNLVHLIHIPLSGLSMFLLVRRLTKSTASAFIGGLIFAFLPFRMLDTNHPNMVSTEGFPLFMLFLIRLFEDKRPLRDSIAAGITVAVIGYMRWQLLILAGFMAASYLIYLFFWKRERWSWQMVPWLGLTAVIGLVLMAPGLYPYLREMTQEGVAGELYQLTPEPGKQDLLSYIVPQRQHPLSPLYDRIFVRWSNAAARHVYSAFLGHVLMALAVVAVVARKKGQRIGFWLGLAVLSFVFALGPNLRCNRILYEEIPLPYQLIGWLPPVRMLGVSLRFNALLGVPLAVLGGFGAEAVREWLADRHWGERLTHPVIFVSLLSILILVDFLSIPTSTVTTHVPAFYDQLTKERGDFAIAGLPGKRHHTERYMFYQTEHERPILGGHVSRLPPEALNFASSVPLIADMYEEVAIDTSLPDVSRQLSLLAAADFKYVIIHKDLAKAQQLRAWQDYFPVEPRHEDSEVVVYPTAPVVGQDCSIEHELGRGMVLVETSISTQEIAPDVPFELDVVWGTTAAPRTDLGLQLSLVDEHGDVGQVERFEISPSWSTEAWPANAIVRDGYRFIVEPWPRAGEQTLTAQLVDHEGDERVGPAEEIARLTMNAPTRVFDPPRVGNPVGAEFGDDLRLVGYDLTVDGHNGVAIMLHWKALRRMEQSYKFFLHMYDPTTGDLMAQKDVIPKDWSYPTVWWEAEEIVSDKLRLSIQDVPAGRYELAVGVYDPETSNRLRVHGQRSIWTEGALILQDVIIP